MTQSIRQAADAVLDYTTGRAGGAPGVVAMVTDRNANVYEGVAGTRELGKSQPMTLDTVLALFSTTKALTGTCVMQLVEEGKIKLKRQRQQIHAADRRITGSRRLRRRRPTSDPSAEARHHRQRLDVAYLRAVLRILQRGRTAISDREGNSIDSVMHFRIDSNRAGSRPRRELDLRPQPQYKERVRVLRAPFPDQHFTVQDILADSDKVFITWLWAATHQGDIAGFPATGNPIKTSGATVYYFDAERLTGHWQITDRLGVFMQLRQGLKSA